MKMIPKAIFGTLEKLFDYRDSDKTHCIEYDGEEEVCHFDLTIDFLNGDIVLL